MSLTRLGDQVGNLTCVAEVVWPHGHELGKVGGFSPASARPP